MDVPMAACPLKPHGDDGDDLCNDKKKPAQEHVNARGERKNSMKHEMILPHELVATFYENGDRFFRLLIGAPGATSPKSFFGNKPCTRMKSFERGPCRYHNAMKLL